jgi:hypothetical protein
MLLGTARSVEGSPIRLTQERWEHIRTEHPELRIAPATILRAVSQPDLVVEAGQNARQAVAQITPRRWLVVVYVDRGVDGFILTAYETTRRQSFERRRQLWP